MKKHTNTPDTEPAEELLREQDPGLFSDEAAEAPEDGEKPDEPKDDGPETADEGKGDAPQKANAGAIVLKGCATFYSHGITFIKDKPVVVKDGKLRAALLRTGDFADA